MRGRNVYTIGHDIKVVADKEMNKGLKKKPAVCLGEAHISVARLRLSRSDPCKFTVFSGTKPLVLRAENSADRQRWINALKQGILYYKQVLEGAALAGEVAEDPNFVVLRNELMSLKASEAILEACTNWAVGMKRQHDRKLEDKEDELLDLQDELQTLEQEKMALEETILQTPSARAGDAHHIQV